jgi:hypothetical protein
VTQSTTPVENLGITIRIERFRSQLPRSLAPCPFFELTTLLYFQSHQPSYPATRCVTSQNGAVRPDRPQPVVDQGELPLLHHVGDSHVSSRACESFHWEVAQ